MKEDPLRIFLPQLVLCSPSGYLLGCQDVDRGVCCVTGVIHNPISEIKQRDIENLSPDSQAKSKLTVIGYIGGTTATVEHGWLSYFVHLTCQDLFITNCKLSGKWKSSPFTASPYLIFYEPNELLESVFLQEPVYNDRSDTHVDIGVRSLLTSQASTKRMKSSLTWTSLLESQTVKQWLSSVISISLYKVALYVINMVAFLTKNRYTKLSIHQLQFKTI